MAGPALHLGAVVMCSHAGPATPLAPFPRVLVSGQPVVTLTSPWAVTGCALTGTPNPPCVTGQFVTAAFRVQAGGSAVVSMGDVSMCVPTGTPLLPAAAQVRVQVT
jgi:hypothetical protein